MNRKQHIPNVLIKAAGLVRSFQDLCDSIVNRRKSAKDSGQIDANRDSRPDCIMVHSLTNGQKSGKNSKEAVPLVDSHTYQPPKTHQKIEIDQVDCEKERKKKNFNENITASNYFALSVLFLIILVCNICIWFSIVS
jgi:hypothetical protein